MVVVNSAVLLSVAFVSVGPPSLTPASVSPRPACRGPSPPLPGSLPQTALARLGGRHPPCSCPVPSRFTLALPGGLPLSPWLIPVVFLQGLTLVPRRPGGYPRVRRPAFRLCALASLRPLRGSCFWELPSSSVMCPGGIGALPAPVFVRLWPSPVLVLPALALSPRPGASRARPGRVRGGLHLPSRARSPSARCLSRVPGALRATISGAPSPNGPSPRSLARDGFASASPLALPSFAGGAARWAASSVVKVGAALRRCRLIWFVSVSREAAPSGRFGSATHVSRSCATVPLCPLDCLLGPWCSPFSTGGCLC